MSERFEKLESGADFPSAAPTRSRKNTPPGIVDNGGDSLKFESFSLQISEIMS